AQAAPDDMAACILAPESQAPVPPIHVEELEADARVLDGPQVRRFLNECQLPAAEIERTIDLAGGVAAVFGTALLRLELDPTGATASVVPPGSVAPHVSGRGEAQPADEQLLQALIAS